MTNVDLTKLTIEELVGRFVKIGLEQDKALDADDRRKFNRLYREMDETDKEIRRRGHDSRLALLCLYDHSNAQVRLQAARFSYGVAPDAARKCLKSIADSKLPPQYLHAGMSLAALDNGTSMLD